MTKNKLILICFSLVTIIFTLDQCSTINISSSSIFKEKKYDSYSYIKDGVISKNYKADRVATNNSYAYITYDTLHNYFILDNYNGIQKIDCFGNISFKIHTNENYELPYKTHYAFSDSIIYDLSNKTVRKEFFKEKIFASNEISNEKWIELFESYYYKADIVIYGNSQQASFHNPIFFKVNKDWILLYLDDDFHLEGDRTTERVFENYPPKYNKLVYLKDEKNKIYSNWESTSDQDLKMSNSLKLEEETLSYKQSPLTTLFFEKEQVTNKAAYTSIPLEIGGTAYYKLELEFGELVFKEKAQRDIKFFSKVNSYLSHFSVPKQFENKTAVSFLKLAYPTSNNESGSRGIYIIKKK